MGVLTVRNLDDDVQRRIRLRAAQNGRSMEAEARAILSAAVSENRLVASWLEAVAGLASAELADTKLGDAELVDTDLADDAGADPAEFELPERSAARGIDFG